MNQPYRVRNDSSETGTALIVTLFFVLLISALVLMLLFSMRLDRGSTQSYSQAVRVQELTRGAVEEILADLKMEIVAGSRPDKQFLVNSRQLYVPTADLSSQPARIGFLPGTDTGDYATDADLDRISPVLIRVSRSGVDPAVVFPPTMYDQTKLPIQRASAVSTTAPSVNGRVITPKRWNAPLLLGTEPPARFAAKPPEWVYYSRSGSRAYKDEDIAKLRPSDNLDLDDPVLGRYAFVIYDQGGLLDINSCGYPSSVASLTDGPAAIRGKSSTLYASLESLPELAGKKAELDSLVNWRNKGTIDTAGGFLAAVETLAKTGFLKVNAGDNPLLSRSDLIDYFRTKLGTVKPLAYLGTFSRSVTAPTSRPVTPWNDLNNDGVKDASETVSTIDYDKDADTPAAVNRDLGNVRFTRDAAVAHFDDDGITKTYTAKTGDPLLQSRFSLARLAWLEEANPETGAVPSKAAAIKSCFGLVWDYPGGSSGANTMANGGNRCWNYVGADGTIGNLRGMIKTLEQVSAEGREPDFFELLKAAILSGSLGKGPGEAAFNNGRNVEGFNKDYYFPWGDDSYRHGPAGFYCHTFGPSSTVPVPARITDMQIIRIGANIIDQYDKDSYPTAIYFKYTGVANNDPVNGSSANPIFGPVTIAYGVENLPYLQSIRQVLASPTRSSTGNPGPGTDLATNVFAGWRQPYLWNPHQPPQDALQSRPGTYQIRAYGTPCLTHWQWSGQAAKDAGKDYTWGLSDSVSYFETNSNKESSAAGTLSFTLSNPTSASTFCFHDKPYPLMQDGLANISATSPFPGNLGKPAMAYYDEKMPDPYNIPNHFVGFSTGVTRTVDPGVGSSFRPFYVSDSGGMSARGRPEVGTNTYVLGWVDGNGGFHPYSYLTGVFTFEGFKLEKKEQRVGTANPERGTETWLLPDPRTERFSLGRGLMAYNLASSFNVYWDNNKRFNPCARPRTEAGFFGQGWPWQPYSFASGDMMVNSQTDTVHTNYYTDPDGIVRPGDGLYATPATGDGLMSFIRNGAPTGTPYAAGDKAVATHGRKPVVLNRPFRSVAELGYVFRDTPFKTLDFFSNRSADTALLDVFALRDTAALEVDGLQSVAAGRLNLNSAPVPVLTALLKGGAKKEFDSGYNLNDESEAIAKQFTSKIHDKGKFNPLASYRSLAPALVKAMRERTPVPPSPDKGNKAYLEAPLRSVTESTDFRTWNLLIDVIAQSGRMADNATTLANFTVQGEYRIWLHVAIDRYTGQITARELEPVYE